MEINLILCIRTITYQLYIQINTFVYYQMSEIQNTQQQEEVKPDNTSSDFHSLPSGQFEKVEDTVALEISQLGGSSILSSGISHQGESGISRISSSEKQQPEVLAKSIQKVEGSFTLTSSIIQEAQANNTSGTQPIQNQTVKSEVVANDQQETAQNQSGQVEVAAKVEPAKVSDIQDNQGDNAPSSPKAQIKEPSSPVLLSPRQSVRRSASPAVSRGKFETVSKMLTKEEERTRELQAKLNELTTKKQKLEKELNQKIVSQKNVKDSQEEEARINLEKEALKKVAEQKKEALKKLEQARQNQEKEQNKQLEAIKSQNHLLEAEIEAKRKSDLAKKHQFQAKLANAKAALQAENQKLGNLQGEHKGIQSKKQEASQRATQLGNTKQAAQDKLIALQKQKQEKSRAHELAKENLLKRIAEVKGKINTKKQELTQIKNQTHSNLKEQHEKINQEISRTQAENHELLGLNKRLEQELSKKSKENTQNKQAEKKKERKIIDLTKRSEELTKKVHDFKEEIAKLDSQKQEKKVVRYEQKVPEELLTIQAKNEALRKEIRKINERYEAEKAQMDRLVPPSVIESMNKKISAVIATNEKFAEVSKIIEDVTKQNEKLAVEMDNLEWGENSHLKDLETERKKQEEKNKALEEELQSKKKQLQQLSSKLQQYVKEYPDFKPEKKKKPEPQPEPKVKKEEKGGKKTDKSPPVDEPKKKKGNPQPVVEPKVEQVKVEEPKPAGKGKKKKATSASEVIQVKEASPPPVQVKVQKNKVEVKPETKSEIKSEKKVESKVQVKSEIKEVSETETKQEAKKEKKKKK